MTRHRPSVSPIPPSSVQPAAAVLVARHTPDRSPAAVEGGLAELRRLLEGLGISVAATFVQRRGRGPSLEVLGKGKLAEVARALDRPGPRPLVVVDEPLGAGQLRLLERDLGAQVIDRTDVILRVFACRARTRTAQLEVELARLTYEAPRVRDDQDRSHRTGGGGGRGERGHTNVELRKQEIRGRIAGIEHELEALRPLEQRQRERRRDLTSVVLVGYTNAGKSSLMRGLTGSDVLVEDKLFATLGTTVRAVTPATVPRILVADTIGFIENLPHELIASFRATLDEARDADLLLIVIDAADARWRAQLEVTRDTLAALGPDLPPALLVFNKIDRVPAGQRAELARAFPEALATNALDPADLAVLRQRLVDVFASRMVDAELLIPVTDGRRLADIRAHARVLEERLDSQGAHLHLQIRALPESLARWQPSPPPGH
jgi:GTP-binding protein HflX